MKELAVRCSRTHIIQIMQQQQLRTVRKKKFRAKTNSEHNLPVAMTILNMKKIVAITIVMFLVVFTSKSFSQTNEKTKRSCMDSLTQLEGYFVRVFKKSNIRKQEKNRIAYLNKGQFKINIDNDSYSEFFISKDSTITSLKFSDRLQNLNLTDKKEIHLRCTSANYAIFNEQFCIDENLKKDACQSFVSNKYYSIKSNANYCYQIFYISATWLKATADKNSKKWLFAQQTKYIDPTVNKFDIYLLYNVIKYTPDSIESTNLLLWNTVPAVFL